MPAASSTDAETISFLIACIKSTGGGTPDWNKVAEACSIVSPGAAAKRYSRLLAKSEKIEVSPKNERRESPRNAGKAKKRKTKHEDGDDEELAAAKDEDGKPETEDEQ